MKFTFFTNCISPHQLPLAKALLECLGEGNYKYIYTDTLTDERKAMGWGDTVDDRWCQQGDVSHLDLQVADIVMSGVRALDLFEKRNALEKQTFYTSERWFKPSLGFFRVFVPSYFKMARRFLKAFASPSMMYLPMGIHAARDMARLWGFLKGDIRCLFSAPKVAFESQPWGAIVPLKEAIKAGVLSEAEIAFGKKHGFVQIPREHWGKVKPEGVYAKMRLWGYFVEPSKFNHENHENHESTPPAPAATPQASPASVPTPNAKRQMHNSEGPQESISSMRSTESIGHTALAYGREGKTPTGNGAAGARLRVLWVGRMLDWKRVDVLVKACLSSELRDKVELHLYGHGPEEKRLRQLASGAEHIYFHDFVPVEKVRDLMRSHDVYVLPSDGGEGWGAVVSEALEEGMTVVGTIEAGASATMLSKASLYRSTSVDELITLLLLCKNPLKHGIETWTVKCASNKLISLMEI